MAEAAFYLLMKNNCVFKEKSCCLCLRMACGLCSA